MRTVTTTMIDVPDRSPARGSDEEDRCAHNSESYIAGDDDVSDHGADDDDDVSDQGKQRRQSNRSSGQAATAQARPAGVGGDGMGQVGVEELDAHPT